jgi:hypothetical protein
MFTDKRGNTERERRRWKENNTAFPDTPARTTQIRRINKQNNLLQPNDVKKNLASNR